MCQCVHASALLCLQFHCGSVFKAHSHMQRRGCIRVFTHVFDRDGRGGRAPSGSLRWMFAGICGEHVAVIDLSARLSVFSESDCIPAYPSACLQCSKKERMNERKKERKRFQPLAGFAAFSYSFPWPFHSATSAETSFHSSCCSQLVNLHTLLFFTKGEGGRKRKRVRGEGGSR